MEENRWVLKLAEENEFIAGGVGWVDLASDACEDQLLQFKDHPKFVGVRHITQDEPDQTLVCRKISSARWSMFGAKTYAEKFGLPESADDLDGHRFVTFQDGHFRRSKVPGLLNISRTILTSSNSLYHSSTGTRSHYFRVQPSRALCASSRQNQSMVGMI